MRVLDVVVTVAFATVFDTEEVVASCGASTSTDLWSHVVRVLAISKCASIHRVGDACVRVPSWDFVVLHRSIVIDIDPIGLTTWLRRVTRAGRVALSIRLLDCSVDGVVAVALTTELVSSIEVAELLTLGLTFSAGNIVSNTDKVIKSSVGMV